MSIINWDIGRQPVPGEEPRFGSVWTWGGVQLMALAARRGYDWLFLNPSTLAVDAWVWHTSDGSIMPGWRCLDEGPA